VLPTPSLTAECSPRSAARVLSAGPPEWKLPRNFPRLWESRRVHEADDTGVRTASSPRCLGSLSIVVHGRQACPSAHAQATPYAWMRFVLSEMMLAPHSIGEGEVREEAIGGRNIKAGCGAREGKSGAMCSASDQAMLRLLRAIAARTLVSRCPAGRTNGIILQAATEQG
jgi:hypothetical protein